MMHTLSYRVIIKEKREFIPLILEADPCETMIEHYLNEGTMVVAYSREIPVCIAMVTRHSSSTCEIKALATVEKFRHQGIASQMIRYLLDMFREEYSSMIVGTAEPGVSFYEQFGFVYSSTDAGFFTRNYPDPVYDGGFLCKDMIILKRELTVSGDP